MTRPLKGYKGFLQADKEGDQQAADRIIKNIYRTLMTRGMKGYLVYCTDFETAAYFQQNLALPQPY